MILQVQKSNLETLLQRHVEMAAEIKNLDTDLQMLVYENYNKFISATEAIKRQVFHPSKAFIFLVLQMRCFTSLWYTFARASTYHSNGCLFWWKLQKMIGLGRGKKFVSVLR